MPSDWYNEQPSNRNYLSPTGFQFGLENFKGVDFFCQSANIPDISMPVANLGSKFRNIPIRGSGGVEYGDLQVTFLIDEDFANYMTIQNWIRKFGLSEGHSDSTDKMSAGYIVVLTSNFNGNFYVRFEDLFPVSLTGVQYDASVQNIDYLTATAVFKFKRYKIQTEQGVDL